jgi:hypothetical protein
VGPSPFGMLTSGCDGGPFYWLAPAGHRMDGWMRAVYEDSSSSTACWPRVRKTKSSVYIYEVEVVFYETCRR